MSEVDEISNTFLKYSDNYRISYGYNGETERMEITNLDKRNNNVFWPYYCQTGLESKSDGQRKIQTMPKAGYMKDMYRLKFHLHLNGWSL